MHVHRCLAGVIVGTLTACAGQRASAEAPSVRFQKDTLTITTDRYAVTWRRGCLVRATNRLVKNGALTLDRDAVKVTDLPNGLGSFHAHPKGQCLQHHVVFSHKLGTAPSFPAQHPVGARSRVTCDPIPNGRRLTYAGLDRDATATLVQELTVEPGTGDLVIRQRGTSAHPGVFGISTSLLNLRPDISFAVPYFGGQRFGADLNRGTIIGYAWPTFWAAGVLVGEVPQGGSFVVFADDPRLRGKYFKLYDTKDVQALSVEATTDAPYDAQTEATVCPWRFNTFAGSWIEPAERYKQWLVKAYHLTPRRRRTSAWIDDTALVVTAGAYNRPVLEALAKRIDPKRVLVLDLGWAKGFNRRCPHYQPADAKLAENVAWAHRMGYHYGVYTAQKLIDRHAFPDLFDKLGLELTYDALWRAQASLDATKTAREAIRSRKKAGHFLIGVHPGRTKWIAYYADVIAGFHKTYGVDLFYEDVTGANCGSSGVVDGRTLHEGSVACDLRIRKMLPRVALAGEYWTEVNVACHQDFGLSAFMAWFGEAHRKRIAQHAHPIMSYLFSDFCSYVSYRTPVRAGAKWHWDQHTLEVMGAWPTWKTFRDDAGGEAQVVLERARLFADGFRPYFPKTWAPGAVAYMRRPDGRVVRYVRKGWSSFCIEETPSGDRLRYARLHDRKAVAFDEPVHVDGWVAYGARGPIGLDASRWTCVFPGAPKGLPVTITALPDGVHVAQTRLGPDYALVCLAGKGRGTVRWTAVTPGMRLDVGGRRVAGHAPVVQAPGTLLFGSGPATRVETGQALPVDTWSLYRVAHGTVIGKTDWHYKPRPWKLGDKTLKAYGVFPFVGGRGAEVSIDGRVRLPDDKHLALAFHMGRFGGVGDGVHYVVRVNGAEVWRTLSRGDKRVWTPARVPLGRFAGREVVLSLALDNGPSGFNLSCDESLWGDVRLVKEPDR